MAMKSERLSPVRWDMGKDNRNSFTVEGPEVRNPFALHASQRRAVKFKDRREERGGTRNRQRDYREEE